MENEINDFFLLPRKILFLLRLSQIKSNDCLCFSDFERHLGYDTPQQDLRRVLKILLDNNILEKKKEILGIKFYELKKRLLRKKIEQLNFYKEFANFIYSKTDFHMGV